MVAVCRQEGGRWWSLIMLSQRAFALRAVVAKLPLERYALLRYLIEFLTDVHAFAHHNQMTSSNLAIVFGPVSGGGRRRVTR